MSIYLKCKKKGCKRKILSVISKCKCNKHFCPEHKLSHSCTYDYQCEQKKFLKKNNPIIENSKFIRI